MAIFTNNMLIRGNRASKKNFQVLVSPNEKRLGTMRYGLLLVDWETVLPMPDEKLTLSTRAEFEPRIGHLLYNPFISDLELDKVLSDEHTRAIVIETYGIGDLPDNNDFFKEKLKEAQKRGVLFYAVTQCGTGFVSTVYVNNFMSMGISSGFDLLTSSCIVKLSILLGQFGDSPETVKQMMNQSLRGEVTESLLPHFQNSQLEENIIQEMLFEDSHLTVDQKNSFFCELVNPALLCQVLCQPRLRFFEYMVSAGLYSREKLMEFRDSCGNSVLHFFAMNATDQIWKTFSGSLSKSQFAQLAQVRNDDGMFPLLLAIVSKNRFAVKVLKDMLQISEKKALVEGSFCGVFKRSLLESYLGSEEGEDGQVIKLAVFSGFVDLNGITTLSGSTLLHLSVLKGEVELLEILLEQKVVDPDSKNLNGQTALDLARLMKKKDLVALLQEY